MQENSVKQNWANLVRCFASYVCPLRTLVLDTGSHTTCVHTVSVIKFVFNSMGVFFRTKMLFKYYGISKGTFL